MGIVDTALRTVARRRLAALYRFASDPGVKQREVLLDLVRRARRTEFGREHRLGSVHSPAEFRAAVPLRDYAGLAPWWDRARDGAPDVCWPGVIRHWAITSGTTAGEKYLPVSRETIATNRRGGFDALVPCLASSHSRLFEGKLVFLGGCTALREHGSVWIGDNTGIMTRNMPALVRRWHVPSQETARIPNWQDKIARAAAETVDADVRMLSGVPSWVLLFAAAVIDEARRRGRSPRTLSDVWPRLELFVHGGVSFAPYRERFLELVGAPIRCTDTYSASEGGMLAVQDLEGSGGMLPLVDQGVYFEFVPVEELDADAPTRLGIEEVQTNRPYAVVLSTDSGIFGYVLGDLVRFVSKAPMRLEFHGRIAHQLSAFGEHVSGGELERAVALAAGKTGSRVVEFAAAARFPDSDRRDGEHHYWVEFAGPEPDLGRFAELVDRAIAKGNEDYATHRSCGLRVPRVRAVPAGAFYAWMKQRGKFGGQNKVPRVVGPSLESDLSTFLESFRAQRRDPA